MKRFLSLCVAAACAGAFGVASAAEPAPVERPLIAQFGDGFVQTTQTLATTLGDTVKTTVNGTVGLAGSVTGIVAETVKTTVTGTVEAAGKVGGVVADGVKTTVVGTARVAGKVGGVVADGVKTTVTGTVGVAGSVGGAVVDGVRATAFGTVRAAGTATGVVLDTAGATVNGAVRVADAVGTIVAGVVSDAARNLIEVPKSVLDYATSLIGTPYKWGGTDADSGLDCSGFVLEVVKKSPNAPRLPRTARDMSRQGEKVDKGELKPGDLVFFNTRRRPFSHVGIYLGDDAFVHAASGRKSGKQVRIDRLSNAYYTKRYNGARRLADLAVD